MKFTFSWLKKFLSTEATAEEIGSALTEIGLELEEIEDRSRDFSGFVIGRILEANAHPSADKLRVCKVETAGSVLQIVCGAPNARAGIKVVVAKVGAVIPNGNFSIKASEIRGVKSEGMMCSEEELELGKNSDGIIELPDSLELTDSIIKHYGLDDPVLDINVTPNRGDALGVYGIARDLAAKGIGKLKTLEVPSLDAKISSTYFVKSEDEDACPLFSALEIKGLSNKQTPDWLKKLLEATGIGSISPVVDVTNYIAFSFGQPMHAYDADKLSGGLTARVLESGVKFHALNDKEYSLERGDLVIADDSGVQCLAGIIGGSNSACDENTRSIILEAACFNPDYIIKTGRRLQIDTSSRYRFERKIDKAFTLNALKIAASMILEICGGQCLAIKYEGSSETVAHEIDFSLSDLATVSGIKLPISTVTDILTKLGFGVNKTSEDSLHLEVPSWRHDISIKEDIVEEILRIYGYDHLPEIPLPSAIMKKLVSDEQERVSFAKRVIAGRGYDEVVAWSFMDSKKAEMFTYLKDELTLLNPISSELDYMRPSIIPSLLVSASKNIARSIKDISIFEVGPIFANASPSGEVTSIAGIRSGLDLPKNHYQKVRPFDVFDIKADIEVLFGNLGFPVEKCRISAPALKYYHPTRSATLTLGKNVIGYFGQLHPQVLKKYDIDSEVVAFELNLMNIPFSRSRSINRSEFKSSIYHPVTRDYAFVVDSSQAVGEMISYIKTNNRKYVQEVILFDVYSGNNIARGKKSVALSVLMQAEDRTLNEADLNEISERIISGVQGQFGAELRDA